jgi:N-acyl homoserine lactone hydrolase
VPRIVQTRVHWDLPHLKYRLVEGDQTLLPGIDLIESSGHVPGHQSVLVQLANTGPVLIAADAVPSAAHVDPDTREMTPFDLDETAVRASTRKLVDLAQQTKALILRGHEAEQWSRLKLIPEYYD